MDLKRYSFNVGISDGEYVLQPVEDMRGRWVEYEAALQSAEVSATPVNCAKGGETPKPPAVSNCDGCGNKLDEDNYVHLCSECYESVAE